MHVLLLRPIPGNGRFGLGPFFRIEPLGMEHIAAALEARGHRVTLADLRFTTLEATIHRAPSRAAPRSIGIACMHALETDAVRALAARVRRALPRAFILVGGHSAAAYPRPFLTADVDAICVDEGELVVPLVVEALEKGRDISEVAGPGAARPGPARRSSARQKARPARSNWTRNLAAAGAASCGAVAVEIRVPGPSAHVAGGDGAWILRFPLLVLLDLAVARSHVPASAASIRCARTSRRSAITCSSRTTCSGITRRAAAVAKELLRRGIKKQWVLVQSRVDLVARHPELLETWKPFAREFDIFFGLEAATNSHGAW